MVCLNYQAIVVGTGAHDGYNYLSDGEERFFGRVPRRIPFTNTSLPSSSAIQHKAKFFVVLDSATYFA